MKVKITVIRKANYSDLSAKYERPLAEPCTVNEGDVFVSEGERPNGFCESAWVTLEPFVRELSRGGGGFYGDWMKNPRSAMISCNDGFRPVSFLLDVL